MKLLGAVVLYTLLLVTPNDSKRQKKKNASLAEEVKQLKTKVDKLTAQVQELQKEGNGVHVHISSEHHDHDFGHHTGSTNTAVDTSSTNTSDAIDSSISSDHDHNHDHGHRHHHDEHNHYPHVHDVYVNMKLEGECHDNNMRSSHEKHEINAQCEMMPNMQVPDLTYRIRGHVILSQKPHSDDVKIQYDLRHLNPGQSHAIHIHESGDMTECCNSLGNHYNPNDKQHGLPDDPNSHVGDLGNVTGDDHGLYVSEQIIHADLHDLIGRAFVIHANADDGGASQGIRLACCVIGRAHENNHDHHDHHDHDHHDHDHHDHHDHDHHDHDHHDHDHHDHHDHDHHDHHDHDHDHDHHDHDHDHDHHHHHHNSHVHNDEDNTNRDSTDLLG